MKSAQRLRVHAAIAGSEPKAGAITFGQSDEDRIPLSIAPLPSAVLSRHFVRICGDTGNHV